MPVFYKSFMSENAQTKFKATIYTSPTGYVCSFVHMRYCDGSKLNPAVTSAWCHKLKQQIVNQSRFSFA